jgi:hypothetical protein
MFANEVPLCNGDVAVLSSEFRVHPEFWVHPIPLFHLYPKKVLSSLISVLSSQFVLNLVNPNSSQFSQWYRLKFEVGFVNLIV